MSSLGKEWYGEFIAHKDGFKEGVEEGFKVGYETAKKELQERKTGKWVLIHPLQDDDCGGYMCSCCKSGSYEVIPKTWKACPWCTALMEVDE